MKKKSSLVIILILLVLSAVSVYLFFFKSKPTTVDKDDRNFKFKDTASITRIFIADKEGDQSDIVRTNKGWVVNNKYACRSEAILNLLEVIKNVEVKMPVPKEARQNILKSMSTNAMKVEIYSGDELVKQYYVGHETEDAEGSYMLLTDVESGKNYEEPYACFIPGFVGFLQPRFIAKENEWRDRIVINYTPPQIKSITVNHFELPKDSSFTIELANSNSFKLKDATGNELNFDMVKLKQYLVYFQNLSYEVLITNKNKKLQDSLREVRPFCEISVATVNSITNVYRFYRKQYTGEVNPELNVKYDYDPDRLYMQFDGDKEWALLQYFAFGKMFITRNYFAVQPSVKK